MNPFGDLEQPTPCLTPHGFFQEALDRAVGKEPREVLGNRDLELRSDP